MNISQIDEPAFSSVSPSEALPEAPAPEVESDEPIKEFARRGFDGTRIETVAREAQYNKALVYRHFGNKEGLFRAALKHKLDERFKLITQPGTSLSDVLSHWFVETLKDPDYVRLIVGEALYRSAAGVVDDEWRHEYYQKNVALAEVAQEAGDLPKDFEPGFVVMIFASIFFFPVVLPQLARMMTGFSPETPEFQEHLQKTLITLEEILRESAQKDAE